MLLGGLGWGTLIGMKGREMRRNVGDAQQKSEYSCVGK